MSDCEGWSLRIIVDADACPRSALETCFRLAAEFSVEVFTVASFNHNIQSKNHFTVGDSSQESDIKVMNLTSPGDIVVTQDWGLAAMVLGKGAKALGVTGKEYAADTIEFLLEERELKARLRRGGGRTKGPKKRTALDDERFEKTLRRLLSKG
jgi:uncharacterized protein YaiI (UPF0178 family)